MAHLVTARRFVAAAVWMSSWALAIAALILARGVLLPAVPLPGVFLSQAPLSVTSSFAAIGVTVALLYGPVSALLIARRAYTVGSILAIHAVGSGIAAFGVQWGLLGASHEGLPLWGLVAFAAGWGFVPGTFLTAVLPILVTRQSVPSWQRVLVGVGIAVALLAFAASLVQQSVPVPRNPLAIQSAALQDALPLVYTVLSFAAVALSLVSCAVLVTRWWRAHGKARTGTAWLLLGHAFLTLSYAALVLPADVPVPGWFVGFALIAPVLGQVLYPTAILVVVLGQRLWGVQLIINRVVLWVLLSACGVAVYLLALLIVPRLLPEASGLWLGIPLLIALATHPLRRWLQRRIDLLVYGEGIDAQAVLARLGQRIGELDPGAEGLQELCSALQGVLRLRAVEVVSARSSLTAVAGDPMGRPVVVPLGSETFAELRVWAPGGQRLDTRTLGVLGDVAGLVATTVSLIESTMALDAARGDLIVRRAEERRRIQRELHDGLGPSFAGIGFGLAAVENLLHASPSKPAEAGELLQDLSEDLARRVRGVRALAGDVSPSPLDGSTLEEAITDLAERFTTSRLHVRTDLRLEDDLIRTVAEGAYFIAAEAMSNAARHADATAIEVVMMTSGEALELVISDDGAGFDVGGARGHGIGLTSMRQRAAVLGGALDIDSTDEGTRVIARLSMRGALTEDIAL